MDGRRQRTVLGGQQEGNAVGYEDAAAGRSSGRPGIQDERVGRGSLLNPSGGDDAGVNLIHPGQVPTRLEPEQLLEPMTVRTDALRVVTDVEGEVPTAVDTGLLITPPHCRISVFSMDNGTGPQAAGGEVPAGPRAQIHLDQVCCLAGTRLMHHWLVVPEASPYPRPLPTAALSAGSPAGRSRRRRRRPR